MDEKRIVLIKPGDVLLIGGYSSEPDPDMLRAFREATGIAAVAVFGDDIDIDSLTAEQLATLAQGPTGEA